MRRITVALSVAAVACALAACGWFGHEKPPSTVYSPNGEPLEGGPLGHPACATALDAWFARVDRNHDGVIDLDEYLADARRQFSVMDLDHDGVLTPDVLARYRAPFQASGRMTTTGTEHRQSSGQDNDHGLEPLFGSDRGASRDRAPRADQPDPVMAADARLRFEVRLTDFLVYQRQHFTALDSDHDGRLSKEEIESSCE